MDEMNTQEALELIENSQLDEISKKTLGSYIKNATIDAAGHAILGGDQLKSNPERSKMNLSRVFDKRVKGINKAVDKLTKEDLDVRSLISAMSAKNAVDTEVLFNSVLGDRISTVLDNLTQDTAQNMFNMNEARRIVSKHEYGNRKAVVYKDPEWDEHHVELHTDGKLHKDATYHTNGDKAGKSDAEGTAKLWISQAKKSIKEDISVDDCLDILENSQLDELSKNTLKNYVVSASSRDRLPKQRPKSTSKRLDGIKTAVSKMLKKEDFVEDELDAILESSQLDEISKATLGSYIKKAKDQYGEKRADSEHLSARNDRLKIRADKVAAKRSAGINKATDKLIKGE